MTEGRTQLQIKSFDKIDSPSLQTYYTNSIDILMSVFDFVLTIGQMRASGPDAVVIEQQARVIMSPQHLKTFARLLAEKVAQYEANIGVIPEAPVESHAPSRQATDAAPG